MNISATPFRLISEMIIDTLLKRSTKHIVVKRLADSSPYSPQVSINFPPFSWYTSYVLNKHNNIIIRTWIKFNWRATTLMAAATQLSFNAMPPPCSCTLHWNHMHEQYNLIRWWHLRNMLAGFMCTIFFFFVHTIWLVFVVCLVCTCIDLLSEERFVN